MYTYDWEPKAFEFEENGKIEKVEPLFSGKIKVRAPKYTERLDYLKRSSIAMADQEIVDASGASQAELMAEIAKKHIIEVELKRLDDGFEFNSVDDMEYDADAGNLLIQVASSVVEGVRLGKDLKRESGEK